MNSLKVVFLLIVIFSSLFSSDELKKVSLQLQWKHQFQFAGYYMAKEKGFYKEAGFEVDIKEFQYGMNVPEEIINGNSTFGTGRPTLIINRSKGERVVLLASIFQSSPNILLALKDSNIKTIEDFKNKRVMVTGDAKEDATIMSMIFSQSMNINDLEIKEHSFNIDDLINNKTDLMSSYISNEPFLLKEKGIEGVIFDPKDYGFDFYNDIIFTTEENLHNNHEDVKSFTLASLKGWRYAFDNIEETAQLILEKYNTQNKSKAALLYEGKELKKLAYYDTDTLGKIDKSKVEKIFDYYRLMGFTKEKIDFNDFVYTFDGPKFHLTKQEVQYLKDKEKITMCIDPNWMPFEKFDDKGDYVGMSADYYKIFEKMLSTKFDVIPTKTWSQSLEFAQERKCDILSLVMETPKRKEYLDFTKPYLRIPLVFATKPEIPFINEIKDLKGKKVGIPKGYAFVELLKNKHPYLNIIEVDDIDNGLDRVNNGELFAYIGTLATVAYKLQTEYSGELKIAGKVSDNWELGIGVRNDDRVLFNILQKTVDNITYDQNREILNKWVSVKYEKGVDYDLVWQIIFVVLIIISYSLYRQYRLKKHVQEISELIDATMEAIFISKGGKCLNVNQSAVDILGYGSKNEMIGKPLLSFVADDTKELVKEKVQLDDAKPYEGNVLKKDGKSFPALIRGHNIKSNDLRLSSVIDITHLKQLESQSKLAAMGEMIGNIAHQWRQPLSIISSASTGILLKKEYGKLDDKDLESLCIKIDENAQYLSQTIDDFRNFIKGDTKSLNFNLKNNTDSFIKLVDSTVRSNSIQLILDLEEDASIKGYPNELVQCFINIFNNAKDAFNINNITENERYVFISQRIVDGKVIISFKDNAGGIPENVKSKIFEPYFTTKHEFQGTGLGLHMTYNLIVNHMKGTIYVNNEEYEFNGKRYKGAKFTITLPLS